MASRIWFIVVLLMSSMAAMAQTGPGGVGDLTTNRFWFDATTIGQANSTPVASWTNYGGNTTSAAQATVSSRPTFLTGVLNGMPVVRFDGTDDYLDIASNTDLDNGGAYSQRTFIVSFTTGANVASRQVIYQEGGSSRGLNMYVFNGLLYFGAWNLVSDGPGSPWGFSSANTAISSNTTYVMTYLFNGNSSSTGTIQCFLNGTQFATVANIGLLYSHNPATLGAETSGTIYENGASSTNGKYFTGDIAEFIHYNTAINIAQRIIVENYLAAKYGITLSASDFYQMDNALNGNFDYEMAGIGQVDNPANRHIDAQGTSVVRISGPTGLDDGEYLLWGHNNGSISPLANTADVPTGAGVNTRYDRVWRSSMVGSITSYDVRLFLTCSSISINNVYLLIDTNGLGDFADETVAGGGVLLLSSLGSGQYIRTAVTALTNGRRFTFGFDGGSPPIFLSAFGPGGIGDNSVNRFWVDAADIGQANNTTVTTWVNKGGNATSFTQGTAASRPTFLTAQANGFPLLRFDGVNDYYTLANNTDLNSGGPYTTRTFSIMFRSGGNVTARQMIFEEGGTGRGMNIYIYNGNLYIGAYNINTDSPDTPWGFVSLNTGVAINTNYILTYIYRGNTCKTGTITAYLNGVQIGTINSIGQLFGHTGAIGLGATNADTYDDRGAISATGDYFNGMMGEFIMYNFDVNTAQRIIIENYLAAKYGIVLGANDIYTMDDAPGNYDYQVAGVGRSTIFEYDNDSKGPGAVHILNPDGLGDNEYFIWGHDNLALNSAGVTDLPTGVEARLARVWRPSETGDVGSFTITFDLSTVPGSKTAADLRLLVDRNINGVFADETVGGGGVISGATSLGSGIYQFTNVNIDDGQRFTIGSASYPTTPLPITLLSFTAQCAIKEGVRLQWKTASELNNDHFNVEKSIDGKLFYTIGTVPGAGTTINQNSYALIDREMPRGVAYYRLSQVDFDGTRQAFSIISADCPSDKPAIQVYPNPTAGNCTIELPEQAIKVEVIDHFGRKIIIDSNPAQTLKIDLSNFPDGVYLVIGTSMSGKQDVQKVMVVH